MDTTSLIAFALALGLAAAIPGPGIAAIVGRALGAGFRPTLPMMAGLIVGDLAYLSAAALGLGVIAASFGTVFIVIRWLGAAYLVYLAIRLWTAKPEHGVVAARPGGGAVSTFLAGLAVTLGNPKVILFYLAILPTIVDLGGLTALAFAEMSAVVIVDLVVVIGAYAALAARARRMFESAAARRRLNRVAGASMMGAAAAIAARG